MQLYLLIEGMPFLNININLILIFLLKFFSGGCVGLIHFMGLLLEFYHLCLCADHWWFVQRECYNLYSYYH